MLVDLLKKLIPGVSGVLIALMQKGRFKHDAVSLRWAADSLESQLWRYRTRTGEYRLQASEWDDLTNTGEMETIEEMREKYEEQQKAITTDPSIDKFHENG
eukprot:COSAG02_NODE_46183_length_351_cov_0.615079_1_plen_100_part_01